MTIKLIFSSLAIIITFIAFVPYIRSTLTGEVKPHVFSWVIWGATTFVVFLAQLQDNGGMGAWSIGLSGAITVFIAALAFVKKSDITVTRIDWLFLIVALISLPFWYFTSNPLWAVVILTIVNILGFGPTIRKAYAFPHDENITFFFLFIIRNTLAIMALENYSVTTMLFPVAVNIACLALILMLNYRRKVIRA
jgi:hypothetical protein